MLEHDHIKFLARTIGAIAVLDVLDPCLEVPLLLLELEGGKSLEEIMEELASLLFAKLVPRTVSLGHPVLSSNLVGL